MAPPRLLRGTLALLLVGLLACLGCASAAAAGRIGIQDARLTLGTADGSSSRSYDLAPPAPIPETLPLERDSVLKLVFNAVAEGTAVRPAQAHVQFKDVESGEVASYPVVMKGKGRGRLDLKATLLPPFLQGCSGTVSATLYLAGGSSSASPLAYTLATLRLAPALLTARTPHAADPHALPPQAGFPAFRPQAEIQHTFRAGEKEVNGLISALGTAGVVGGPWAVLLVLSRTPLRSLPRVPAPSLTTPLFLLGLGLLEALILIYWTSWTLGPFIPAFLGAAGATGYVGKLALGAEQARRLRSAGAGGVKAEVVPAGTMEGGTGSEAVSAVQSESEASTPAVVPPRKESAPLAPALARTSSVEPSSAAASPAKSRKKKAQAA